MKTPSSFSLVLPKARHIARLLSEGDTPLVLQEIEHLLHEQPELLLHRISDDILESPLFEEVFPSLKYSVTIESDLEESPKEPRGCLALLLCLSPYVWSMGTDFSTPLGEAARDTYSELCRLQLTEEPFRSELLRQVLGGALWSSSPSVEVMAELNGTELSGTALENASPLANFELSNPSLDISYWRQARLLRLTPLFQKNIQPLPPDEDPSRAFDLALFAAGCPPEENNALWIIDHLGNEAAWATVLGDHWARQLALTAADTLCAPLLERCSAHLQGPDDLLARQGWAKIADASQSAFDYFQTPAMSLDAVDPELEILNRSLMEEAIDSVIAATRRCAAALMPAGLPTAQELLLFPEEIREALSQDLFPATSGQGAKIIAFKKRSINP